jgi:tetratricopeptide (TPR) repeat protein
VARPPVLRRHDLTGAPPFTAETPIGVLTKHITDPPRPPREHNAGLSASVNDIILRLLAKDPDQRPATAADVARELRSRQSGEVAAPPAGPSDADRLVDEGFDAIYRSVTAGPTASSHLDQAEVYLKRALTLDPRNARGLCAMANWQYTMGRRGFLARDEAFAKGRELLLDALAADDRCAEVHDSMGKIALFHDDDCHAALRHIERCVALEPDNGEALRFQSIVYKVLGRIEDAVRSARAATKRKPDLATVWNGLGDVLLAAGRTAEAIDPLKRAIAIQPGYGPALERLELARARLGELDLAAEIRASRLRLGGRRDRADLLDADLAASGAAEAMRRDLRRELEELLGEAEMTDPFEPYYMTRTTADQIVVVYAALGEWHKAMDWVERSYERRPVRLRRLLTEPPFDRRGLAGVRSKAAWPSCKRHSAARSLKWQKCPGNARCRGLERCS